MRLKLYTLLLLLLITGCGTQTSETASSYTIKNDLFNVSMPYVEGIAGNYINSNIVSSYDLLNIDQDFMYITKNYFDIKKDYIMAGQFLDREDIKFFLSEEMLNTPISLTDQVYSEQVETIYIHEQNYINGKGVLQGIALSMIINKNIHNLTEAEIASVKSQIIGRLNLILPEIRKYEKLESMPIVFGIYSSNNSSNYKGSYIFEGRTITSEINELKEINSYVYNLSSLEVKTKNQSLYDNYRAFNNSIKSFDDNIFVNGEVLFNNTNFNNIEIKITTLFPNHIKVKALINIIADEIEKKFDYEVDVKVTIYSSEEILGFITRNAGSRELVLTIFN